jgi:chemotaxis methyl-accepting protein methylase
VVFPDPNRGRNTAVNLTPPRPKPASEPNGPEDSLTPDEYECIRWLFQRAGLNADRYRRESIKRRIPACLRSLRVDSLSNARIEIQRNHELLKTAISALLIGVTGFFRDPTVFDTIRQIVIPEILGQRQSPRIWSAACSDGCELYSVAMLLGEREGLQRSMMLGTDCRPDALARAKEGRYDAAFLRQVPGRFLDEYFHVDGPHWQIHPYLRSMIQWRVGNILGAPEPGGWDLVLCRNIAIYLDSAASAALGDRISKCLRPGGFLVLGKAERLHGNLGLRVVAPCVYRLERT